MIRSLALALALAVASGAAPAPRTLATLDLQRPFDTVGAWRIVVTQGPDQPDPIMGDEPIPGVVRACLSRDDGRTCTPALLTLKRPGDRPDTLFADPHELQQVAVVHPSSTLPLLLVRLASLHSGDGDQSVVTWLLRHRRAQDDFVPVYRRLVGHNNNQEVRYVGSGPLRGAVIVAEPTSDAPFGYWIEVDRLGPDSAYHRTLRYRSATRYDDGNALAVIDSEMPAIEQRLSVWRAGQPLPHPASCRQPRLVRMELWCAPSSARSDKQ